MADALDDGVDGVAEGFEGFAGEAAGAGFVAREVALVEQDDVLAGLREVVGCGAAGGSGTGDEDVTSRIMSGLSLFLRGCGLRDGGTPLGEQRSRGAAYPSVQPGNGDRMVREMFAGVRMRRAVCSALMVLGVVVVAKSALAQAAFDVAVIRPSSGEVKFERNGKTEVRSGR